MSDRATKLLRDIQSGALDSSSSVSDLLRKCVALGGAAGSRDLVVWASLELNGFKGNKAELPSYRKVAAPLVIDGIAGWTQFRRQHIAPSSLPEFARDAISEEVPLVQGIGTLEELAARSDDDAVTLSPAGSAELVRLWNHELQSDTQDIHRLYWLISKSEIAGVMHQIRNRLVTLIAEFEIEFETASSTGQAVDRALQVTMGDGARVAIVSAEGRGSRNNVDLSSGVSPLDQPKWSIPRFLWTAAIGIATIAAAWFGYLALLK